MVTPARVMQIALAGMGLPATVSTSELCPVGPMLKIELGPIAVKVNPGREKSAGVIHCDGTRVAGNFRGGGKANGGGLTGCAGETIRRGDCEGSIRDTSANANSGVIVHVHKKGVNFVACPSQAFETTSKKHKSQGRQRNCGRPHHSDCHSNLLQEQPTSSCSRCIHQQHVFSSYKKHESL